MSEKLKAILAALRSHFEEIYGDRLVKMVLFGSQARGEADADSDIDVLVVLKGEVNPSCGCHLSTGAIRFPRFFLLAALRSLDVCI